MNKRCLKILDYILKYKGEISYKTLSELLSINERTIRYDIDKINEILNKNNYPILKKTAKGQITYKNFKIITEIIKHMTDIIEISEYKYEIILFKTIFIGFIKIKNLEIELNISRSTIKNVIKDMKQYLLKNNLKLEVENKKGLVLYGAEENIRKLQLKFLLKYSKNIYLKKIIENYYDKIDLKIIKYFLETLINNTKFILSDEPYLILYYYLFIMIDRIKNSKEINRLINSNFFLNLSEYKEIELCCEILETKFNLKISENEKIKLTDWFLGSHCYSPNNSSYRYWIEIDLIAKKIIQLFSKNIGVNLLKDNILLNGVVNHLKPTIHRLKNEIQLENSILKDFLNLYKKIFIAIKNSVEPLEKFINLKISDEELAFLGTHFKVALDRHTDKQDMKNNILIVCGSGYGTSKLLSQQLSENFTINIIEIIPFYQLKNYNFKNIDLIISTVSDNNIKLKVPFITVNTILSKKDVDLLEHKGLPRRRIKIYMSDILNTIQNNCTVVNKKQLIKELKFLMKDSLIDNIIQKEQLFSDMLVKIILNMECETWKNAIQISGNYLVQQNICKQSYINSIEDKLNRFGSYMVMDNMLAIPHSRNEKNVFESKMILVKFKNIVIFPNNTPVKYMLLFTSTDGSEHLDGLSTFLDLINNYNFLERFEFLNSEKKVIEMIKKYEFLSNLGK